MRLRILFAALLAVGMSAFAASPALANDGAAHPSFDPQTTNVPYLAWRGEEVRLVKCVDDLRSVEVDWIVEDWSGYPFQPPSLETSTVDIFEGSGEHYRDDCVKANFVSLKAGLAQIKLVISDAYSGDPIVKHQFLVGWLGLNTPTLASPLDGLEDVAGGEGNRLRLNVTGTLPLGNNFSELGMGPSITLPSNDWATLAGKLATTSDSRPFYRDAPWRMWDIHDDQLLTEGHVDADAAVHPNPYGGPCGPESETGLLPHDAAIDAVDNCKAFANYGEADDDPFSRIWGDLTGGGEFGSPTEGPWDPLRPNQTFLGDGNLNAGDVPMPAARIDFAIAENAGDGVDLGGVGFLAVANKGNSGGVRDIYERRQDAVINDGDPHNLYAPYYEAYIPATRAEFDHDGTSSGTDTADVANNYPNYQTCLDDNEAHGNDIDDADCEYDYWDHELVLRSAVAEDTDCLRRYIRHDNRILYSDYRETPSGPHAVVTYSDEHGEAWVEFKPGLGFFFDNLGLDINLNNGCDLEDIDVLGRAAVTAIARYPAQKVTDPDKASNTLTKVVHNLFHKEVVCVPKGEGIFNSLAFICTATAIDIDGRPFVHEEVCFMTNGEGMREYPLGRPDVVRDLHRLCVKTDSNGQASVEVFGKCQTGNVIAEFVDEGLIRYDIFTFGCPPGGAGGTSSGSAGGSGSAAPAGDIVPGASNATIRSIISGSKADGKSAASSAKKAAKAKLAFARIQVKSFQKRDRFVVVRVNGLARTAKIQVTLVGKKGKVLRKVVRTVPTNRTVRVPGLKLPKAAKTLRVKVLA